MLLIYGANGYTGNLIVSECLRRGLKPILAGRSESTLRALAQPTGLEVRVFPLQDSAVVRRNIEGVDTVLHCAGPFFRTYQPMVDACLAVGANYLDITGEIAVFEGVRARDAEARARGVVLLPGVGFDVVPTDCLARALVEQMPDALQLQLAFAGGTGTSRGTRKTSLGGLALGGAVRRDGQVVRVPLAYKRMVIPFRDRPRLAMTIPWGDIATAFVSTGIPNIETYIVLPRRLIRLMPLVRLVAPLTAVRPVRRWMMKRVDQGEAGPSEASRASSRTQVWGRVTGPDGRTIDGTVVTPHGYTLTAAAAVEAALRVMTRRPAPGYHTPSTAFGWRFITQLPDCELQTGVPQPGA